VKPVLLSIIFSSAAFCNISIFISHNNTLTEVSKQDIANLFLKKTNTINGVKVTPIDSKNEKTYQEFYKKIVDKSPAEIHAYWVKQIYTGTKQPPKKLSKKAIEKAIKNNQKIISYESNPSMGKVIFSIK